MVKKGFGKRHSRLGCLMRDSRIKDLKAQLLRFNVKKIGEGELTNVII
jgi:hypothetical protein